MRLLRTLRLRRLALVRSVAHFAGLRIVTWRNMRQNMRERTDLHDKQRENQPSVRKPALRLGAAPISHAVHAKFHAACQNEVLRLLYGSRAGNAIVKAAGIIFKHNKIAGNHHGLESHLRRFVAHDLYD